MCSFKETQICIRVYGDTNRIPHLLDAKKILLVERPAGYTDIIFGEKYADHFDNLFSNLLKSL